MKRVHTSKFENQPFEIIAYILEQLPAQDIVAVEATCRRLKSAIEQSSLLQLIIELAVEGLRLRKYPPATQPCGLKTMSPSERLDTFRRATHSYRRITDNFTHKFKMPRAYWAVNSGLLGHKLTPEFFARGLVFRSLWQNADMPPWRRYDNLGVTFTDFAFEISQDLLVLVSYPRDVENTFPIHLRSLKTGLDHPASSNARLHCLFKPHQFEETRILISGRILVIHRVGEDGWGGLYIWDWMSGTLISETSQGVGGVVFISSTILLSIEHDADKHQSQICVQNIAHSQPFILRLALANDDHSFIQHGLLPSITFMSSTLEFDTPDLPDDLAMSPYVQDETADSIICVYSESQNLFDIIRTLPLRKLYEAEEALAGPSTEDGSQGSYKVGAIPRALWGTNILFSIHSEILQPLGSSSIAISGSRLGLMGLTKATFLSKPSFQPQDDDEDAVWYTDLFVAVLDFNTRPISVANARQQVLHGNPSNPLIGYAVCEDGEKIRHRLTVQPLPISENDEIIVGSTHILCIQTDNDSYSCSAISLWNEEAGS